MTIDIPTFKKTMSYFATGVTIVTTAHQDVIHGMTANAFCSVSLTPPLVLVSIANELRSHGLILASRCFAVNILAQPQQDWAERFAGRVPDLAHRFDGITYTQSVTGSPILPGSLAWIDCRLWATYEGGDHTLFVGEVVSGQVVSAEPPLLYYQSRWSELAAAGPPTVEPWPSDQDR